MVLPNTIDPAARAVAVADYLAESNKLARAAEHADACARAVAALVADSDGRTWSDNAALLAAFGLARDLSHVLHAASVRLRSNNPASAWV